MIIQYGEMANDLIVDWFRSYFLICALSEVTISSAPERIPVNEALLFYFFYR